MRVCGDVIPLVLVVFGDWSSYASGMVDVRGLGLLYFVFKTLSGSVELLKRVCAVCVVVFPYCGYHPDRGTVLSFDVGVPIMDSMMHEAWVTEGRVMRSTGVDPEVGDPSEKPSTDDITAEVSSFLHANDNPSGENRNSVFERLSPQLSGSIGLEHGNVKILKRPESFASVVGNSTSVNSLEFFPLADKKDSCIPIPVELAQKTGHEAHLNGRDEEGFTRVESKKKKQKEVVSILKVAQGLTTSQHGEEIDQSSGTKEELVKHAKEGDDSNLGRSSATKEEVVKHSQELEGSNSFDATKSGQCVNDGGTGKFAKNDPPPQKVTPLVESIINSFRFRRCSVLPPSNIISTNSFEALREEDRENSFGSEKQSGQTKPETDGVVQQDGVLEEGTQGSQTAVSS
ncbi:hypothetical protein L6452_44727 [Arctium lappa]|nr:hypothetical protein L6452_44727 [Arctium lappa]